MGSETADTGSAQGKLLARIQALEKLVAEKDATIHDQEELIDELRGRIENQQSTLAHRMQCINKFKKDRDDLRRQNAQQIAKLAEVGRKQSVAISSPPQAHRNVQRASTIQVIPIREERSNNDKHSDVIKSASLPPDSSPRSSAFHPPPPPSSSSSSSSTHLTPPTPVRPTRSSLPDPVGQNPSPLSETLRQDRFEPITRASGARSYHTDPKNRALPEVVKRVRSPPPKPTEDSDTDYSDMEEEGIPQGLPPAGKRHSGLGNGVLPSGGTRKDQRIFNEPVTPPVIQKGTPTVAVSRTKAVVSLSSSLDGTSTKRSSGSEAVAKKIKHIIKTKSESSPDSSPNSTSSLSTARAQNGGSGVGQREKPSPLLQNSSSRERSDTVQEHKPLSQELGQDKVKHPLRDHRLPSVDLTIDSITLGMLENVKPETSIDSQTSGGLFDDITSSEIDSSCEFSSSPVKQQPLKSAMKKPQPHPLQEKETSAEQKSKSLRRIVTLADPRYKVNAMSMDRFGGLDDSVILDEVDGEEEDELTDMNSFQNRIRKRTQTLAVSAAGRDQHFGRKNRREIRREIRGRNNSLININSNNVLTIRELELISPDMEARIRDKICNAIGEKYGGREVATKAAITIQHAYRQYKIKRRFLEIRREANPLRKRALSMSNPRRRPSIMRKKELKYRRELSSPSSGNDQLQLVKEASSALSKERPSHVHSGVRSHLMQQKRSEQNLLHSLPPNWSPLPPEITVEEEGDRSPAPQTNLTIDGVTTTASSTDPAPSSSSTTDGDNKPDGEASLPTSFSSDQILSVGGYERPLSVFSEASFTSSYSCQELKTQSLPPGGLHAVRLSAGGEAAASRQRVVNVGVNHFNRKPTKGVQYLVSQGLLEDDPHSVARFLMEHYGLSKEKIGQFLGEINNEFNMAVLECLVEMMDMGTKCIDEALRQFQQIFRMPGEAQKIDRIMEIFALEYYKFNKEGAIKSEDGAYILSFAIMMLHTALHNPSVRNRTTKKQWVSMNRGCNDGSNYPEQFLLDIYDRIQQDEFTTGQDHTQEVALLEKQILGYRESIPRLSIPSRHLLLRVAVTEVGDINTRPTFRGRHRRLLFMFSDLLIVCKERRRNEYQYRDSFSMLSILAIAFETHHFKYGVQLRCPLERCVIFQFNCDCKADRVELMMKLENAIAELTLMENERMAELGTSIAGSQEPDSAHHQRSRLASGAGDLISSSKLNLDLAAPPPGSKDDESFVRGVGDLAVSDLRMRTFSYSREAPQESKRVSGDSGIDSQQQSPQATPTPSPSPTEGARFHSPSPSPTTLTPSTPPHSHSSPSTPHHQTNLLSPRSTTISTSKSSDAIRSLTVTPSNPPQRSPSAELFRKRGSSASSEKEKKGGGKKSRKSRIGGLFGRKAASQSPPAVKRSLAPVIDRSVSPLGVTQSVEL